MNRVESLREISNLVQFSFDSIVKNYCCLSRTQKLNNLIFLCILVRLLKVVCGIRWNFLVFFVQIQHPLSVCVSLIWYYKRRANRTKWTKGKNRFNRFKIQRKCGHKLLFVYVNIWLYHVVIQLACWVHYHRRKNTICRFHIFRIYLRFVRPITSVGIKSTKNGLGWVLTKLIIDSFRRLDQPSHWRCNTFELFISSSTENFTELCSLSKK